MKPVRLPLARARRLWLAAQRLDHPAPFGAGAAGARAAIAHLGYVQIDTINVIERCHHHILFTRIPDYRRADLWAAQSRDKTVFEYWTHALSYVPIEDFRFYVPEMHRHRQAPSQWLARRGEAEYRRVLRLVRDQGPLAISDIEDRTLIEKDHPWASRKPSKAALQLGFFNGVLTVSERRGMLKTYDLTTRHFGWDRLPHPATDRQVHAHLLARALRTQALVSPASILHTHGRYRPELRALIDARVKARRLRPVVLEGAETLDFWADPASLETPDEPLLDQVHILSPFDPLVIQRKRLELFFGYTHLFEAYVPKDRRRLGYFALPVLIGDRVVAAIDLKADRENRRLLIQNWTWTADGDPARHQAPIDAALERFERFQFADRTAETTTAPPGAPP